MARHDCCHAAGLCGNDIQKRNAVRKRVVVLIAIGPSVTQVALHDHRHAPCFLAVTCGYQNVILQKRIATTRKHAMAMYPPDRMPYLVQLGRP